MPRPHFVILALFAILTAATGVKAVNKEELRRALRLPWLTVRLGYGISGRGYFVNNADWRARPGKIARLEREMKGDATDAERYRNLGRLYGEAEQLAESKEAFSKAVKLFRQQYEQHSGDNCLRLRLAEMLEELKQYEEAEALLRRAVKEAPNDWRSWVGLAKYLDWRAYRTVMSVTSPPPVDTVEPSKLMHAVRPTSEQIAASRRDHEEANACYERAIALAPREAEIYLQRGAARYLGNVKSYQHTGKGKDVDLIALFAAEVLPDLRQAVYLSPEAYEGIGAVSMLEALRDTYEYGKRNPKAPQPETMLEVMSESSRNHFREDMTRLNKGMLNPDKHKAAEAAEVLGFLQFTVLHHLSAAENTLRQSITLDPSREAAWDLLESIGMETQNPDKAAEVCHQRLRHLDSAHNRFLLAKTNESYGQFDKAEREIHAGLERFPNDFMLKLARANLLLMRGTDEELTKAGQLLSSMRADDMAEGGDENRWGNYVFSSGIYFGLIGESKKARQFLEDIQKRQPEFPFIKEALEALGDSRGPLTPPSRP